MGSWTTEQKDDSEDDDYDSDNEDEYEMPSNVTFKLVRNYQICKQDCPVFFVFFYLTGGSLLNLVWRQFER